MPKTIKNKKADRETLQGTIKDNKCCICFNDKIKKNCTCPTTLHDNNGRKICDHSFCFKCIHKWSNEKNTCPLCRKTFEKLICSKRTIKIKKFTPIPGIIYNLMIQLDRDPQFRLQFVMDYCENVPATIQIWRVMELYIMRMERRLEVFNMTLRDFSVNLYDMTMLIREINSSDGHTSTHFL